MAECMLSLAVKNPGAGGDSILRFYFRLVRLRLARLYVGFQSVSRRQHRFYLVICHRVATLLRDRSMTSVYNQVEA